jgi:sarcosine oxidase
MSNKMYDLIIIGCGGIGSATLYDATNRGLTTLCIEQHHKGHDKGGTHGESRAFRQAYYDDPQYIPLLKDAYQHWKNLGGDLFVENGLLEIGFADSKMAEDAIQCAKDYQIPIEILSGDQICTRFPGFHVPKDMIGIFQPEAGFLRVDDCVRYFIDKADSQGATIAFNEKVISWQVDSDNLVQVKTNKGLYQSKYLIITTGSWTKELLGSLSIPLQILQKKLVWIPVTTGAYSIKEHSPCFAYHLNDGVFYGFPNIDGFIKVARHTGGAVLNHADDNITKPHKYNIESRAIEAFASDHLQKTTLTNVKEANCLYDLTPDGQFVIDNHPQYGQVAFAAGLSGHAYKMSNTLGKILIDLAVKQSTEYNISFLSLNRFKRE